MNMEKEMQEPHWERRVLEKIALESLKETRAKRRWGIFFKFAGLAYLVAILVLVVDWDAPEKQTSDKHTALINVGGSIDAKGDASAEKINGALRSAFEDKRTAAVILRVNSPGGSPVQAGIAHDEIRRLREKHPDIPLYAVVEDMCASGCYYIVSAADRIFVDKASVVGSIGVLINGFGFTEAMRHLGIERRLLTAGDNKGFLDPFSPQDAQQKAYAETLLREIHTQFIEVVRRGRGNRLRETPEMFSGLMWTGSQSVELGLADDFGTVGSVARDIVGIDRIVDFSVKANLAERVTKYLGTSTDQRLLLRLLDGDHAIMR
ncbi:MAG: S49 family peptidase [Candidatus Accumulibacter sp.]|jgi:protease-4|nr:S49 family peptidase [Accumulibacter sp.]